MCLWGVGGGGGGEKGGGGLSHKMQPRLPYSSISASNCGN